MKIVCGSCGAKYSIADEKVQGKVFKIRCKKCSNVIVVKGNEDGDETVTASVGSTTAAEWYVVVDGEQVGPVAVAEIEAYFAEGRINSETFAWKDGLTDWVALSVLDEFAHLSSSGAGPDEATQISDDFSLYQQKVNADPDETSVMNTSSDFGSAGGGGFSAFESSVAEDDPNSFSAGFSDFNSGSAQDDFGYAKAGGTSDDGYESGGLFSSFDDPVGGPQLQSSSNAGGMFASFDSDSNNDDFLGLSSAEPAAPSRTKSSVGSASAAMANASVGSELVGKRNENSVLFSLSSLDKVQAVGSGPDAKADVPVTDGSGLIDIRALASAHKSMSNMGSGDGPSVDPFTTGTMAMPALMPMGSHRSNKPLIIGGIVGGIFLFGAIIVLGYIVLSKDNTPPPAPETQYVYRDRPEAVESDADKKAAAEAAAAEKNVLEGSKEPVEVANNDSQVAKDPKDTKTGSRKTPDKKPEVAKEEPKEEPKSEPKKAEPKGDGIDRLLDQIDNNAKSEPKKTASKPKEESSSSSGGKDKLDKSDVLNTIKAYSGRINTCYKSANTNNLSGTMKVKFFIKPNGSVTNAEIVSGNFAGTDVGRCVQKAVGGMKFPSTSASDNVPVTYPFKLE